MSTLSAAASNIPDLYLSSLPDDLKLMLRVVHLIERLTKCNLQIKKDNAPPGKPGRQVSKLEDTFYPRSAFEESDVSAPGPADNPEPETPASVSEISPESAPFGPAVTPESSPATPSPAAAVPQYRTWSTSAIEKKAPASKLPASAHPLFQKKKHKKH